MRDNDEVARQRCDSVGDRGLSSGQHGLCGGEFCGHVVYVRVDVGLAGDEHCLEGFQVGNVLRGGELRGHLVNVGLSRRRGGGETRRY